MKNFMLLFRQPSYDFSQKTPAEMQAIAKRWQEWAGALSKSGHLADNGPRLSLQGKVLKPGGVVTDGPFVEIKEILGSFIIVKANNIDHATTLAHGCPALDAGGSVEVREVVSHGG